jgi:hypothetical protein
MTSEEALAVFSILKDWKPDAYLVPSGSDVIKTEGPSTELQKGELLLAAIDTLLKG